MEEPRERREDERATQVDTAYRWAHRSYGIEGPALCLVRPDGYVGYRARAADGAGLLAYLGMLVDSRDPDDAAREEPSGLQHHTPVAVGRPLAWSTLLAS